MGKPNKFNDEMKERLITLRKSGLGNKRLAKELGVSTSTITLWLRRVGLGGRLKEYKPAKSEIETVKTITCKNCGSEYETKRHNTKFCSEKCRSAYNRRNRGHKRKCEQCNKVFYKYKEQRFCSQSCYDEYIKENSTPRDQWKTSKDYYIPRPKKTKVCINCNKEYKTHAPDGKYCSYECRLEYNRKQRGVYNKRCKDCGKWFSTTRSDQSFCTTKCGDRYHYRRKETLRRERIKENGPIDWDISIERLMKRDKGICHLCGNKVDLSLDTNDDYYGSVDHVIPIAKGGTHTWDNVKLAHRICNSYKSDKTTNESEQLALL